MRKRPFIGKHLSSAEELEESLVSASSEEVDQVSDQLMGMLFCVHAFERIQLFLRQQSLVILPDPIIHPMLVADFHEELCERISGEQPSGYSEK